MLYFDICAGQAGNLAFPINVHGISCVPVAFARTTSDTLSSAFFMPRMLLTSSNCISKVYLGSSRKNKTVSSMLYTFSRSYFATMACNLSKAATRSEFSRSTSAPSRRKRSCYIPRRSINRLNHCHDALKSSCNIDSSSAIYFAFKMARKGGTGRFTRRMLSIHRCNLSSTSVNLPTDALNVFFFASSDIRAERLRISSCFDQTFLLVASLTPYCRAILRLLGGFGWFNLEITSNPSESFNRLTLPDIIM